MLYIPEKIKVGYQNRSGTYSGKLAYVIYYDDKGKLRKEPSWSNWRDESIEPDDFDNEPTGGFVLNKKVGDYKSSWDVRHAWCRVYDPRGFEFEISIENLLFILENCNSIKGKGLEGEFVYGWDGTDLVLIPVDSADYKRFQEDKKNRKEAEYVTGSKLIAGYTYENMNNHKKMLYLCRGEKYEKDTEAELVRDGVYENMNCFRTYWGADWYGVNSEKHYVYQFKSTGKRYWFWEYEENIERGWFNSYRTLPSKSISLYSKEIDIEIFNKYIKALMSRSDYSEVDINKFTVKDMEFETFSKIIKNGRVYFDWRGNYEWARVDNHSELLFFSMSSDGSISEAAVYKKKNGGYAVVYPWMQKALTTEYKNFSATTKEHTIEELYRFIRPVILVRYLKNGEIYGYQKTSLSSWRGGINV